MEKSKLYDMFPDFRGSMETKLHMVREDMESLMQLEIIVVDSSDNTVSWIYPVPLYRYREFYNLAKMKMLVYKNKRLYVRA